MQPHFVTSHYKSFIELSLYDTSNRLVWHVQFERFQAEAFVDMLLNGSTREVLYSGKYCIYVEAEGFIRTVVIGDSSPFPLFRVILKNGEFEDLASTIQMHIISSETETRPKDDVPHLDDTLSSGWTPDKEKEAFGDGMDESDSADWWKK